MFRDEVIYKRYLVAVLAVVLASSALDQLAFGLLLQDIKRDLSLSDTQLGTLTGIAFALFYSTMGIPIARWADRGNRVTIISLVATIWSAAVALCGIATSFVQLLLIRIAVAIGEAGCLPAAYSLIGDHFTRSERPRAIARFLLGRPLCVVGGYFVAGWLNEFYGWRVTLFLLGVPGLALALLVRLTLREPRFSAKKAEPAKDSSDSPEAQVLPSLKEVAGTLWENATFRNLLLCFAITSFFNYGIVQWQPSFFIRSFGLTTGEIGTWFAVIFGVGGLLGTYLGGEAASRFAGNNERLQLRAIAVLLAAMTIVKAFMYLSPNANLAFAFLAIFAVGTSAVSGPMLATLQSLVTPQMRAISIAALFFFANLIGMGFGPLAAGALSDALSATAAEESLRYALLAMCPGLLWGAWHVWLASRTVSGDLPASRDVETAVANQGHRGSEPRV